MNHASRSASTMTMFSGITTVASFQKDATVGGASGSEEAAASMSSSVSASTRSQSVSSGRVSISERVYLTDGILLFHVSSSCILSIKAWGSTISTPNSNRACRRVGSSKRSLHGGRYGCRRLLGKRATGFQIRPFLTSASASSISCVTSSSGVSAKAS